MLDRPSLHQIGSDEPGEGEQALHGVLQGMGHAQEQERDQRDGDLNAHGILRCPEEVPNFEAVLDPTEEQFDLPAALVEFGDLVGRRIEIVGHDA